MAETSKMPFLATARFAESQADSIAFLGKELHCRLLVSETNSVPFLGRSLEKISLQCPKGSE
jgi:hypothetical protein